MEAIKMTVGLSQYLAQHPNLCGHVHSVFDGAFNIIDENNQLIGVLCQKKELSPYSMMVNKESFHQFGIDQGQEILIADDDIHFKKRKFKVHFHEAGHIDLAIDVLPQRRSQDLDAKLDQLRSLIIKYGSEAGIAPLIKFIIFEPQIAYKSGEMILNDYSDFIQDRLLELLNAIKSEMDEHALQAMMKIIGFGPGLTPSADDFLSGILTVLYVTGYLDEALQNRIFKLIQHKTTKISEDMIYHTLTGRVAESYKRFIEKLFDETKEHIKKEILDVIQVGSTSGTDYLFGVYCMASLISVKEANNGQI
jgi:hypothetical protein